MQPIPEGLKEDATGAFHRIENIKPIDLMRDELVSSLIAEAVSINQQIRNLKKRALEEVDAFVSLSASEYGVKLGGKKGNVQLRSFNGQFKVVRAKHDFMAFDERIEAAKELMLECARDWVTVPDVPGDLVVLVEHHFRLNEKGEVSVTEVLKLMKTPIKDERWKNACVILKDSLTVQETVTYLRFQERIGKSDEYQTISLDIAGVRCEPKTL